MSFIENCKDKVKAGRAVAELVTFDNAEWIAFELISKDIKAAQALCDELEWQLGRENEPN